MSDPEKLNEKLENKVEAVEASREQLEKRAEELAENKAELSPRDAEATAERARFEALESSVSVETTKSAEVKKDKPVSRRGPISKKQKNVSYKKTMVQVQAQMKPVKRVFSKFIHNPVIEKTSDVVGSTVARPNAVLAGAVSAFVLTLIVYIVAKTIGYSLSGFESIAAFIVGWTIGIVYDYLRILITGKKS